MLTEIIQAIIDGWFVVMVIVALAFVLAGMWSRYDRR